MKLLNFQREEVVFSAEMKVFNITEQQHRRPKGAFKDSLLFTAALPHLLDSLLFFCALTAKHLAEE